MESMDVLSLIENYSKRRKKLLVSKLHKARKPS